MIYRNIAPLGLIALLVGCAPNKEIVVPPPSDPLVESTPIIDIHAHTFNAKFLPIQGIILGKRDKHFLLSFLGDRTSVALANYIYDITELKSQSKDEIAATAERAKIENAEQTGRTVAEVESDPAIQGADKLAELASDPDESKITEDEIRSSLDAEEQRAMEALSRKLARVFGRHHGGLLAGKAGNFDFLMRLIRSHQLTVPTYHDDFQYRHDLMVSHMMDLGPVYAEEPGTGRLIDFYSEQLPLTRRQQESQGSKMIYFVAYAPFRTGANGIDESLQYVKDAIRHKGAFGVKFYPPSGFRPFKNQIPARPICTFGTDAPERQWDRRYRGLTNEELDRRIKELLVWCENEQIPVFAHCQVGEFEARKNYGKMMADPRWWEGYLKMRDEELGSNAPCKLRLCFGHAGGSSFWFRSGKHQEWGAKVHDLCKRYPNVYCEIGVHDAIALSGSRERFVSQVADLVENPPRRTPPTSHPYKIEDKLMYGTDWFMHIQVDPSTYLNAYQTAFLDERLKPHYRKFFFKNAAAYLDTKRRSIDPNLSNRVKGRLRKINRELPPQ